MGLSNCSPKFGNWLPPTLGGGGGHFGGPLSDSCEPPPRVLGCPCVHTAIERWSPRVLVGVIAMVGVGFLGCKAGGKRVGSPSLGGRGLVSLPPPVLSLSQPFPAPREGPQQRSRALWVTNSPPREDVGRGGPWLPTGWGGRRGSPLVSRCGHGLCDDGGGRHGCPLRGIQDGVGGGRLSSAFRDTAGGGP